MAVRSSLGRFALVGAMAFAGTAAPPALGQDALIKQALSTVDPDVVVFNDHLTFLAHPFLGGRLPGTPGMELAKDYIEHYFREAGLEPAFDVELDGQIARRASYRQPFPLGGTTEVTKSFVGAFVGGKQLTMTAGTDFQVTGMGDSGTVAAPVTFVGYGINSESNEYTTFKDGVSLEGRIAMVLRFEPMDEDGLSLWSDSGWSRAASFNRKIRTVAQHNPSAIILVNTPGADDPRAGSLLGTSNSGGRLADVPVIHMTPEAAAKLIKAGDPEGRTLMDLRKIADAGPAIIELDGLVTIDAAIERKSLMAENVGGLLPGKGDLADEIIVIGAHADHLGMGAFGSRASADERGTKLHPGADDNASGTAGIIMIADWLAQKYEQLPDDADARSVLIVAFSGEESGLNGSRYYVQNPITDLDKHYMMLNFDMIGRIENKRLSVSGTTSGEGLAAWVEPIFAESGLEIVNPEGFGGGSDHLPFMQRQVPYLFAIIADFHGDYHTPADTGDKINRVDAVLASRLFSDIAYAGALRRESMEYSTAAASPPQASSTQQQPTIRVRVGVQPGESDDPGVLLAEVIEGGPASKAGLKSGDRLVRWDGQKIADIQAWMILLAKHDPGDEVNVGIVRDGEEVTIPLKLEGRDG